MRQCLQFMYSLANSFFPMLQLGVALISMVLIRTCFFGTEGRRSLREGKGLGGPESCFEQKEKDYFTVIKAPVSKTAKPI